ncbi:MAG: membrane protein insertase YidC [Gallionellaceae bacterium]|nr:membrane protein insertase YidC [Gallionellaceae bacterium]
MEFQRLFLFLIFSFSAVALWDGWEKYQHPVPQSTIAEKPKATLPEAPSSLRAQPQVDSAKVIEAPASAIQGKKIVVKTDSLLVELNTLGGDIQRVELLQHKDATDKNKAFVLLQKQEGHTYIAQTGLLGEGLPTHREQFISTAEEFSLQDGKDTVSVRLSAGKGVTKVLTFHRNSYLIDVGYEIENLGDKPLSVSAYYQLVRDDGVPEGASALVPTYTGAAVYSDKEKFQKIDFSEIEKGKTSHIKISNDGWVAMLQHYFVSAWLPSGNAEREFYTKSLGSREFSVGTVLTMPTILPGGKGEITTPLYVGPASSNLDKIAPGLGLTVDYGWLTIIATPLFWLLTFIQGWVQNWGLAIILLTVLIKLVFFPLSAASYRSMAKMKVVAPKLEKIKQQYSDDREKLNKAMMDLYKTEKINPLGGCLPVLIQIPVFIALYWSILASVELRHAPFIGWITDLSVADPYYIMPAIMGISMLIQGRLNPTPPDPIQAKLMQWMPVVFSVVFFFFPAGLVLYSIVNNVLSIAQQWYITRSLEGGQKDVVKT